MISALDEIDSIVRCIEAGAEDYIPKPFDPVLLGARIEASLETKAAARSRACIHRRIAGREGQDRSAVAEYSAGERSLSRIRKGEMAIADRFPEATILFADLVGFTNLAGRYSPGRIVELLNSLFSSF